MSRKNRISTGDITRGRIRDFVIWNIGEHGYSPSVREIGEGVELKSTSSVNNHLKKMLDTGMLETDADLRTPRAIRVPGYHFIKN